MKTTRLAASLAVVLMVASGGAAQADGRRDWSGYDWLSVDPSACLAAEAGMCRLSHNKWDWKRSQWVDTYIEATDGGLNVVQRLINRDRTDDDYVCTTVVFEDADGGNIAVFHKNTHIDPSRELEIGDQIAMPAAAMKRLAKIEIGSKQCRDGAKQDDDVFAKVLSRVGG